MSWRVVVRPDAQDDLAEAAEWYEARQLDTLAIPFADTRRILEFART